MRMRHRLLTPPPFPDRIHKYQAFTWEFFFWARDTQEIGEDGEGRVEEGEIFPGEGGGPQRVEFGG